MSSITYAHDLKLDAGDVITGTEAIVGIRGSGKTNKAVIKAEGILELGQRLWVYDPLDVWWGLKSSRDGTAAGYPVIVFGGKHQDAPLEAGAGEMIARFVVENHVAIILSMKHLSLTQQRHFMLDFSQYLLMHNEEPLHGIIDEAPKIVPQSLAGQPEAARCMSAISALESEGRASGLGLTLIGQRAARMNKDALTQSESVTIFQTTGAADRKAIKEWVDEHGDSDTYEQMSRDLASLPRGTGYYWNPTLSIFKKVAFRERQTFDSSRTPKLGEKLQGPRVYATVDLAKLTADIQTTIEHAKANDPKELQKRVRQLEAQLAKRPAEGITPEQFEKIRRIVNTAQISAMRREEALQDIRRSIETLFLETTPLFDLNPLIQEIGKLGPAEANVLSKESMQEIESEIGRYSGGTDMVDIFEALAPRGYKPIKIPQVEPPARRPRERVSEATNAGDSGLSPIARKIVVGLGYGEPGESMAIEILAACIGYHPHAGPYRGALNELRAKGLIEGTERVKATKQLAVAPVSKDPASRRRLRRDAVRAYLSSIKGRGGILTKVYDGLADGVEHSLFDVATRLDIKPHAGVFRGSFKKMIELRLIEQTRKDHYTLSAALRP